MILNNGSRTGGGPPLRVLPRRARRARTRLELGRDGPDLAPAVSGTGGAAGSDGAAEGAEEPACPDSASAGEADAEVEVEVEAVCAGAALARAAEAGAPV
jgi:hypothetical protein